MRLQAPAYAIRVAAPALPHVALVPPEVPGIPANLLILWSYRNYLQHVRVDKLQLREGIAWVSDLAWVSGCLCACGGN